MDGVQQARLVERIQGEFDIHAVVFHQKDVSE
jgi:hypothetical protein